MSIKKNLVKCFQNGVFYMNTRRFGSLAEIMIKRLFNFEPSGVTDFDLYDRTNNQKVEVKFSSVTKQNEEQVSDENVIVQCINAPRDAIIPVTYEQRTIVKYDRNIEQVKKLKFDVLYYGLFFKDAIIIFKIESSNINTTNCPGWSEKQHRGNVGEGQFHIKKSNIEFHLAHHFVRKLSYDELFDLLNPYQRTLPIVCDIFKSKIKRINIWKN